MAAPRPASPAEAVQRAQLLLADPSNRTHGYALGGGDYKPYVVDNKLIDVPWTQVGDVDGCDCDGFAMWCLMLRRHRRGYNAGIWSTCSDDIAPNSMIEDSDHAQELFRRVASPEAGDFICYPTQHLPGHPQPFIGHVAIIVGVDRASDWNVNAPQFHLVDIVQVCGGPGRTPAAIATDGRVFDAHSLTWPKSASVLLRAVP